MAQSRSLFFDRWPRVVVRRPWWVLAGALLVLVLLGGVSQAAGGKFVDRFSIPGTEAQQAIDLLKSRIPQQSGDSSTIVIKAPAGMNTPAVRARVEALIADAKALPDVVGVSSPYDGPGSISQDGTIARITVQYAKQAIDLPKESATALKDFQTRESAPPEFQVEIGGQVIQAADREPPGKSELYGIAAAIVILLIVFGSVVAMGLPIITALVALAASFLFVAFLAAFVDFPSFTTAFASMIGLGVGIDYALLIVTRFRQGLHDGKAVPDAVVTAMGTAGRTVLFAGVTVVVAMLGLFLVGIPFVSYLGASAALVVAFAVIVANTVLPAILTLVGTRIDALKIPGIATTIETGRGAGYRLARFSGKYPVPVAIVTTALVLLIALPLFRIDLGSSDAGSNPTSMTTRRAYDLLTEGFGAGFNGPIIIAVAIDNPSAVGAVQQLPDRLRAVPGVAGIAPAQFNQDKSAATIVVIPTTSPQAKATKTLIHQLRTDAAAALGNAPARVYLGGATATFIDLGDKISSRLPLFFAAVIGLSFLLLMAVFRSVLIPIKAAMMNLLAVGAAMGVLVAVFQWGWLGGVFGVSRTGPIESFLPMMLFAILFGLSMDYEVFLVSRIQEEHLHGYPNDVAVERGVSLTMRLISAAAAIMCCVFISFAFGDQRIIKEFGVGLAAAIFIDAFVIRLFLVPALMHLFGEVNWWFPRWLNRAIPNISIEGAPAPAGVAAGHVPATPPQPAAYLEPAPALALTALPPGVPAAARGAMLPAAPPMLHPAPNGVTNGHSARDGVVAELEHMIHLQTAAQWATYEGRLARLEQVVAALAHAITTLPQASDGHIDPERIAALERITANLDTFARTLPSARWHQAQDARTAALDQRVRELERLYAELLWERGDRSTDGAPSSSYGTATPVAQSINERPYRNSDAS